MKVLTAAFYVSATGLVLAFGALLGGLAQADGEATAQKLVCEGSSLVTHQGEHSAQVSFQAEVTGTNQYKDGVLSVNGESLVVATQVVPAELDEQEKQDHPETLRADFKEPRGLLAGADVKMYLPQNPYYFEEYSADLVYFNSAAGVGGEAHMKCKLPLDTDSSEN